MQKEHEEVDDDDVYDGTRTRQKGQLKSRTIRIDRVSECTSIDRKKRRNQFLLWSHG